MSCLDIYKANFKYNFDKKEIISSLKIMLSIIKTYNSGNYNYEYIISLDLSDIMCYNVLSYHYYNVFENPNDKAVNVIKNRNNIIIYELLTNHKDDFYNIFSKYCFSKSKNFYIEAIRNKFSEYPYNLIKERNRKIVFNLLFGDFYDYSKGKLSLW